MDTSGDLVVDDCLIVLANDINAEFLRMTPMKKNVTGKKIMVYQAIVIFQFKRFGLDTFGTETLPVNECTVAALNVLDEDLKEGLREKWEKRKGHELLCHSPPTLLRAPSRALLSQSSHFVLQGLFWRLFDGQSSRGGHQLEGCVLA